MIVVQSLVNSSGSVLTSKEDISNYLFGVSDQDAVLVIPKDGISDDNTVVVESKTGLGIASGSEATDIQFYIYDDSTTGGGAALMLNSDIVSNQIMS